MGTGEYVHHSDESSSSENEDMDKKPHSSKADANMRGAGERPSLRASKK
jgi:hypothetical protein